MTKKAKVLKKRNDKVTIKFFGEDRLRIVRKGNFDNIKIGDIIEVDIENNKIIAVY